MLHSAIIGNLIKEVNIIRSLGLKLTAGLAIGVALSYASVAVADPVTARSSERDGIARIVFTWPTPVPFVARVQNRQLIIQFARPAEGNFSGIARNLSKYLRAPQSQNGGRTLVFPLQGEFDLNYFPRGRTVVVEVVDPNPPKTPEPVQQASKPATSVQKTPVAPASSPSGLVSERVSVRTGEHSSYGRIVFDWKKRVEYTVAKQGNLATVTFKRPANIDVAPLNGNRLANVRGANAQIGGNSATVGLSVPSTSRLKHFRSGSKVVVDVLNPTGRNDAPPIAKLSTAAVLISS